MKKRILSLVTAVIMAAFVLCGCGAPSTVEEYYSQPAIAAQIDQAMEQALAQQSDYLSACDWSVSGNTLVYTYTYNEGIEVDTAVLNDTLNNSRDQLTAGIKEECGVEDEITIEYIYYAADGTVLADVAFKE